MDTRTHARGDIGPVRVLLEFARVEAPEDPFSFRHGRQQYTVRGSAGGRERATLEWSAALLDDLLALGTPGVDSAVVQRVGERLRSFVTPAGWAVHARVIADALAADRAVFVTVRSAAAELYALPWELLVLDGGGRHLGELDGVVIRHEWPETETAEEPWPPPAGPGRVLVAWSAAGGEVPAADHVRAIQEACRAGHHGFDPDRDVLANASLGRLRDALARAEQEGDAVRVVHLLCHGGRVGSTHGLWLDDDGDASGSPTLVEANRLRAVLGPRAHTVRLVVLAACRSGHGGEPGGNPLGSVAQALHRVGIAAVVASRRPLTVDGSTALTAALYGGLVAELRSLEQSFVSARRRLRERGPGYDWASLTLHARAADGDDSRPFVVRPYRGLFSFQPRHERLMFGRAAEIAELRADLAALSERARPQFVAVVGASGIGKSSVALAGVVPAWIRDGGSVLRMRPGADPERALDAALAAERGGDGPCLLVVDQFEELFTHGSEHAARERFARRLWRLSDPTHEGEPSVHVVVTLRVDFVGRCGELLLDEETGLRLDRVIYDEDHRVFVAQMTPADLRAAIERPAAVVGLMFEAGLVDRMLAEVGGEPGSLPLLQDTLDLLWQKRDGRALTQATYRAHGGVTGALHGRADRLIQSLAERDRDVARRLLVRLVSVSPDAARDTRRRVGVALLRPEDPDEAGRFDAVLEALVGARLVVRDDDGAEATLEVAHEALIRTWPTLTRWLEEDRGTLHDLEKLEGWAAQWRSLGVILTGAQLGYAEQVASEHPHDVDAEVTAMLDASRATAERQQQRRRRIVAAAGASAVVFVVVALLAAWQWRVAVRQTAKATAAFKSAEYHENAAKAEAENASGSKEEAQLEARSAREAGRLAASRLTGSPAVKLGFLREVEAEDAPARMAVWNQGIVEALRGPREFARFELGTMVYAMALDPEGRQLAVGTARGAEVIDLDAGGGPPRLLGPRGPAVNVGYSRDGSRLLTTSAQVVLVWDANDLDRAPIQLVHDTSVQAAEISPDGRWVASVAFRGAVKLWPLFERDRPPIEIEHPKRVSALTYSPDGRRLITGQHDGIVTLWDIHARVETALTVNAGSYVNDIAVSPDGTRVVVAVNSDVLYMWNLEELKGGRHTLLRNATTDVVAFTPDGDAFVTGDTGRGVRFLTPESMRDQDRVLTLSSGVRGLAFNRDGSRMATGTSIGSVAVWNRSDVDTSFEIHRTGSVNALAFSPDGRRLAVAEGNLGSYWDTRDPSNPLVTMECQRTVRSIAVSHDGRWIATGSGGGAARVWDADGGALIAELHHEKKTVRAVTFVSSESGTRPLLATGTNDRLVRIWDPGRPGDPQRTFPSPSNNDALAFARGAQGARLYVGTANHRAWFIDADAGDPPQRPIDVGRGAVALSVNRDGTRLATASRDSDIRVWEAADVRAPIFDKKLARRVHAVALSPDGERVATGAHEPIAKVWDVARERRPLALLPYPVVVKALAFSPDGRRLAAGYLDGTVRLWPAWGSTDRVVHRSIWRRLWRASPLCPTADEREELMDLPRARAEADHARCVAMLECVAVGDDGGRDARVDGCQLELRAAQAAGRPFNADTVGR